MTAELLVLRLVHVLAATFWVGSGIMSTFFLMPALADAGPAAGQVGAGLARRKLFTALLVASTLTILSGARLLMLASAGFEGAYFQTGAGRTFSMSGGLAIVAFVFGMLVTRPAGMRSAALGAQLAGEADEGRRRALGEELARVRRRSMVGSIVSTLLITLAAAGMAVARYVR